MNVSKILKDQYDMQGTNIFQREVGKWQSLYISHEG